MDSRAGGGGTNSGEVGPVIGVLAVIAVLGILAGLVGRLCGGRTIMGYGPRIHAEAWLESNFSACLDGHPSPPPRRSPHPHSFAPAAAAPSAWRPSIPRHPSQQKNYGTAPHHSDSQLSSSPSSSDHPFDPHHHHTDSSTPSSPPPPQLHFHHVDLPTM